MGHEAQRRMMASRAVVVGLSGLGAEVAKNVVLAGLQQLTLVDPLPANDYDRGGNFYLANTNSSGAGVPRRGLPEIARGTQSLRLCASADRAGSDGGVARAASFQCDTPPTVLVITIPLPEDVLVAVNAACRQQGVCFIYAVTHGVFGQAFGDFGPRFVVTDKDGEAAATSQIEHVLCESTAVVKVLGGSGPARTGNGRQGDVCAVAGGAAVGNGQRIRRPRHGPVHV